MKLNQFSAAVQRIQQRFPNLKLGEEFTSTISGKVTLHQRFDGECNDFEFFRSLGLVLSHKHFFTSDPVEGIESEFAKRTIPTFINVPEGKIQPSECWRENTVLYNKTSCAWKLNNAKGYLIFSRGSFGKSIDIEYIKWLIATKQVPW